MTDLAAYRPNVGVVLFHPDGRVWLGRRFGTTGTHNWQFPQGGVDAGEDLFVAACRELVEETGVKTTTLLGRTDGWLALRFDGDESEIDLSGHGHPEFDAWRWGRLDEAPDLVVPFKKAIYEKVVVAFQDFAGLRGRAA